MTIHYAVPADFPLDLDEDCAPRRSLAARVPRQVHGGVTFGDRDYYFSYEVRDGVIELSIKPWEQVSTGLAPASA